VAACLLIKRLMFACSPFCLVIHFILIPEVDTSEKGFSPNLGGTLESAALTQYCPVGQLARAAPTTEVIACTNNTSLV